MSLEIPAGVKIGAVKLLESHTTPKTSCAGNWLVVEIPHVRIHEVVAVDLIQPPRAPVVALTYSCREKSIGTTASKVRVGKSAGNAGSGWAR